MEKKLAAWKLVSIIIILLQEVILQIVFIAGIINMEN